MNDTPNGEVRNAAAAPAVTVDTGQGPQPLDDVLADLGGEPQAPTWDSITGKPTAFPTASTQITDASTVGKAVLTAASAADARTATGAGTSNLALGATASTAAAGTHTHPGLSADQAAGTASVRTLGTGGQQAAAGTHTHVGLMTGSAGAVADSAATDVAGLVADHNALLAALRTRGVIT